MAAVVCQTVIELSAFDRDLLDRLAVYLDVPRVQVIRWAIRTYALDGKWAVSEEERQDLFGGIGPLICGPERRQSL